MGMAALPQRGGVLLAQLQLSTREKGQERGAAPPCPVGTGVSHPTGVTARAGSRRAGCLEGLCLLSLSACPRGFGRGRWTVPGDDSRCYISERKLSPSLIQNPSLPQVPSPAKPCPGHSWNLRRHRAVSTPTPGDSLPPSSSFRGFQCPPVEHRGEGVRREQVGNIWWD